MKKKSVLFSIVILLLITVLSGCYYDPPEGYEEHHHSYQAALEYARSIDPNATVSETYTDLKDEHGHKHREWDAVIHGMECHVGSSARLVFNSGFAAGEFLKEYYTLDTDYDYYLLKSIVAEKLPAWQLDEETVFNRYQLNDILAIDIAVSDERALTEEELDQVWKEAQAIEEVYSSHTVHKSVMFYLPAPNSMYSYQNKRYIVQMSTIKISDFTEEGKEAFFKKYYEHWQKVSEIETIDSLY